MKKGQKNYNFFQNDNNFFFTLIAGIIYMLMVHKLANLLQILTLMYDIMNFM